MTNPIVQAFFHEPTNTLSYVVQDPDGPGVAVIDPVLDYDHRSGRTDTEFADQIVAYVRDHALEVHWILETHAHADHLTSAPYLKDQLGGKTAIGEGIRAVQRTFKSIFNVKDLKVDGTQFDHLFDDNEPFAIGGLQGRVLHTPGHTNDAVSYVIGDAAFVGDTLFAPDYGTARADFPGGDARSLYRSIHRIYDLPERTRVFLCHDYPPGGRSVEHEHSLLDHRKNNMHIHEAISEDDFVRMREERDASLPMPNLIIPAVQVNIRGGQLPPTEDNGVAYLKVPVNQLGRGR
jgi:glyoxylase-like metal-dependent hydrolase (beta-lactamase superfamily II)